MRKSRGITLIEILIIIVIAGILAAILFPVFSNARERARGLRCLNKLKSIAAGYQIYSQDYDLEAIDQDLRDPGGLEGDLIGHKVLTWDSFSCPSNGKAELVEGENAVNIGTVGDPDLKRLSYAFNYYAIRQGEGEELVNPKNLPLVFDANRCRALQPVFPVKDLKNTVCDPWRHQEGCNVAFFDGHAKYYKISRLDDDKVFDSQGRYWASIEVKTNEELEKGEYVLKVTSEGRSVIAEKSPTPTLPAEAEEE